MGTKETMSRLVKAQSFICMKVYWDCRKTSLPKQAAYGSRRLSWATLCVCVWGGGVLPPPPLLLLPLLLLLLLLLCVCAHTRVEPRSFSTSIPLHLIL